MLRYFYKKLNNRKGFSLIELIVVVGILGIIAMVAVPRVTTSLAAAKTSTDNSNVRILNNAVELYYVDNGTYPVEDSLANFSSAISKYLPKIPDVQSTGKYFVYDKDATGSKVVLRDTTAGTGELLIDAGPTS